MTTKIVLQGSGTDLSVLEKLTPADLFTENGTEPVFEAISREIANFVADAVTPEGRKEIASMAYKISQSKNFLDKVGKTFNADLKEKTKAVDKERATIWDKLEALQKKVRAPLTEWEESEEKRQQGHKTAMAEAEALILFTIPPNIEQIKTAMARGDELSRRDWEEYGEMSSAVLFKVGHTLSEMHKAAEQAERDRKELEDLRIARAAQEAKDAEEARQKAAAAEKARIEKEATEKAQRDAETAIQAEKDKAAKEAANAAAVLEEEKKKAAITKANDEKRIKDAEDARVSAEAKATLEAETAVQRERDRAAAAEKQKVDDEKARENDRKHHAKINNEVLEAVVKSIVGPLKGDGFDENSLGKAVVEAIAKGQVLHTKISY